MSVAFSLSFSTHTHTHTRTHLCRYNLARFSQNFRKEIRSSNSNNNTQNKNKKDAVNIEFPRVSPRLLSESVLVETWAKGKCVSHFYNTTKKETEKMRQRVAAGVFDITLKMFLRDNFVHSDMHAGNAIYDEKRDLITLIDAGMATELPQDILDKFGDFIRAVVLGDDVKLASVIYHFHDEVSSNVPKPDATKLHAEVKQTLDKWRTMGYPPRPGVPTDCTIGDVMADVFTNISKLGVVMRSDVSVVMSSMQISEGLIIGLDPSFDIIGRTPPYFVRYQGWGSIQNVLSAGYNSDVVDSLSEVHENSGNLMGVVDKNMGGDAAVAIVSTG